MTQDDELVERLASAIYEARNGHGCRAWNSLPNSHKEPYRLDGRASLAALRAGGWEVEKRDASAAKDAEIARLREALSAACGYMRNAAIDLGTGAPKKTALATVEGGLKLAEAALKEASHG